MVQHAGTPARPNIHSKYGGPGSVTHRDSETLPRDFDGFDLSELLQNGAPLSEDVANHQCFSGVDYTITAVIPYQFRFAKNREAIEGAERALAAFSAVDARDFPPGKSASVDALRDRAAQRQILLQALELAESQAGNGQPFYKTFGEIQTLSITSRRSAEPVRRLTEVSPAEYTKGPRTFAGTMIFTLLQEDVLLDLYRVAEDDNVDTEPFFVSDRLPPFNLLIQGSNEAGFIVESALFGVELIASGMTLSIDDLFTEQQFTYVARWMLPMAKRSRSNEVLSEIGRQLPGVGSGAISSLEQGAGGDGKTRRTTFRGYGITTTRLT